MSLTVTNLNTMQLLNIVNRTASAQSNVLTQLSTGYKINKASDNPAGLIAMENFNAELTAVQAAMDNNQRADAMLSTAEGGLTEVSSLLSDIESLVVASVNDSTLSNAEIAANQAQIDNALAAIDRIVNTTTFNGKQLLNGAQAIQVTGLNTAKIDDLRVFSRGNSSSATTVTVSQTTAADSATADITIGGAYTLSAATEIVITGSLGSQTISLSSGDDAADIITAIDAATAATGVDAVANGNEIRLESTTTGSDAFVEMKVLSGGGFAHPSTSLSDIARTTGTDAVVTVNGREITADGTTVNYNANGLSMEFSVQSGLSAGSEEFSVTTTGGMTFQLGVDSATKTTMGIDSMGTHMLGGGDATAYLSDLKSGGSADLSEGSANTLKAVRRAIEQVASAKGRIGGFQKFQVQTSINSLAASQEALSAAKSIIADTDYAQATAELNRQSVLLNSGMTLLGMANQQAAQILSLLG